MASLPPQPSFQSNYPRGQAAGVPYIRPPGVYFDSIGTAFEMIKADFGVYAVCSLILMAVYISLGTTANLLTLGTISRVTKGFMFPPPSPAALIPQLFIQFLSQFLLLGLIGVGVRHALGHWPTISDQFLVFKRFGKTAGAIAILMIPTVLYDIFFIGFMPNIKALPDLWLAYGLLGGSFLIFWLLVSGPLYLGAAAATFSDLPTLEAFGQAFKRLRWQCPLISILFTVAAIVGSLGFIACCVGIIFTFPIWTNVIALHYTYYFPPTTVVVDVPLAQTEFPSA